VPLPDLVKYAVAAGLTGVLAWASFSDVKDRRIPNIAVIAVIGLAIVWAVAGGVGWLSALAAFAIALAIGVALYAFKIVGAGDSKLFAAVALFAGLGYLPFRAVAVALAGGVLAAVSLATRPRRAMVMFALQGKGDFGRGIPYGVAIAIGAALVTWAALTGYLQPYGAPQRVSADDIAGALSK
jgi:prepilin peptidase CpaA